MGKTPNPPILLFDADALFQVYITAEIRILQKLRDGYEIQPVIMPEVETELFSHSHLGPRFSGQLNKSLSRNLIKIACSKLIQDVYRGTSNATASSAWASIQHEGATLHRRVQRGEAYSYAASLFLSVPVVSHDQSAIRVLERNLLRVPDRILRVFDLLVLGLQIELLEEKDCENARARLLKEKEWLPPEFQRTSFVKGVSDFVPRLLDETKDPIGAGTAEDPLLIRPSVTSGKNSARNDER